MLYSFLIVNVSFITNYNVCCCLCYNLLSICFYKSRNCLEVYNNNKKGHSLCCYAAPMSHGSGL